jgi:integrase/recombinase XerD
MLRMSTSASVFFDCKAGFYDHLLRLGYSRSAATKHRALFGEFIGWAEGQGIAVADLATAKANVFFDGRRGGAHKSLRSPLSLRPLFAYLREVGVVAPATALLPAGPIEVFLDRYRTFLMIERGLTSGTSVMYLRVARQFAAERVVADGLDWSILRAGDVTDFAERTCAGYGVSWARQIVSALRCLLRYLQLEGQSSFALDRAVLAVAGLSPQPPRGIGRADVEALLSSCDRQSAMGRRDYAILVLLCRLGLRGGEAIGLTLDDIDWRTAEIVVVGKNGRRDRLPLQAQAGEALADYLQQGRPPSDDRAVFLRHYAPIRRLGATGSIRSILERACARAGIAYVHPHRLRHTIATEMLAAGVTLRDIGQVLGHQGVATTAIYAKVDLDALRAVARGWPTVTA